MPKPSRRDFIGATSATVAAVAGSRLGLDLSAQTPAAPSADPLVLELANEALNVARSSGASYADVRIGRYRRQIIRTRERLVASVTDDESYGLGIRTLVDGCWGFAATSVMTRTGVQNVAREAITLSRAARTVQRRPVELAPAKPVTGTWITPVQRDPIEVPLEDKIALLLGAVKTLVTSEGTNVTQTFIRVGPSFSATAIATGDFQTYEEELAPRGQGWEYEESLNMRGNAELWA